ncbi:heme-binding domain-containing protein [uncultured Winogradskyella sp.]|uniref:heme-binding domain-containing protein n=1 Tax=uncultured Winogradskyella sp. TaxID=395353 RepID=UPI0030D92ECF|tara:strand:+ start:1656 stop:2108 length:453 start_codon:yes stop_codon:yes gene_type:complete
MKVVKKVGIILLIAFVGIQFIPTKRNQSDVVPITDIHVIYNVPKQVETIFKTSCYDCHSNNTSYPWYNKIQPVAWLLENHIDEGKSELNFNEFGDYSGRRQKSKLKSIASQIRDNEMPLSSYTIIHQDAKLSEKERELVIQWVDKTIENL